VFPSLSLVVLIAAAAATPNLRAQQTPLPHDTVRGAVRTVDTRTRTLEVVTGVGYALRVVRLDVPADVPITAAGVATLTLGDLKPGDVVAVSFGRRTGKSLAYSIQRVGRMETGPEPPR
jgi:hypothetical protein